MPPRPLGHTLAPWLVSVALLAAAIAGWVWGATKGPDTAKVPRVVGAQEEGAVSAMRRAGFRVRIGREASASEPEGSVLHQAPNPGASLERGARVDVIVSMGRPAVAVPKLIGLRSDAAVRLVKAVRLRPSSRVVVSNVRAGTVVTQNPAVGSRVAKGTTIFLTVSKGPPLVTVPGVRGLAVRKAVRTLSGLGLIAVTRLVPSARPTGTVVAQSPARGKKVVRGSKVRLNVSSGPAVTTTTATTTGAATGTVPTTTETVP